MADLTSHQAATLSQQEAAAKIARLTDGEKISLMKIARLYARHGRHDHRDLIREAITRIFAGTKAWPREADAIHFLSGVIRSVTWEWKGKSLPEAAGAADIATSRHNGDVITEVDKIVALFDDDETAKKIVIAMMIGIKGDGLQTISGLDNAGYESKRTNIRCRIENFFATEQ
jgi:hypothetical protein